MRDSGLPGRFKARRGNRTERSWFQSRGHQMKSKHIFSCRIAAASALALAALATGFVPDAGARGRYFDDEDEIVSRGAQGTPLLAVVGLAEQRVTIYSAKGKMME